MTRQVKNFQLLLLTIFVLLFWRPATAQNPCEGRGACDALLINKGRPWDYQVSTSDSPLTLNSQTPDSKEQKVIESLTGIFNSPSIRGIALLNGDKLVHSKLKENISEQALFYGLSLGKTVTAIAAGQAICQKLIALETKVGDVLPEFSNTDMGKASLQNLLTMSSGTWEGLRDANVATQDQFREPGTVFSYRNSDPEMVALMIAKVTGMSFSNWVDQSVLKAIPIAGPAVLRTDRHQNAFASGAVQMTLKDWARFAVWIRDTYDENSCLGSYLKDAAKPQISVRGPNGPFVQFNNYGYFTWVDHKMVPDSFYAQGFGGQIVAWNKRNKRMMVVFSNESPANELGVIYREWSKLP